MNKEDRIKAWADVLCDMYAEIKDIAEDYNMSELEVMWEILREATREE